MQCAFFLLVKHENYVCSSVISISQLSGRIGMPPNIQNTALFQQFFKKSYFFIQGKEHNACELGVSP
jgi:hypothetical protein